MKATLAGQELHYLDEGQGPAVVFLHAFPLGLSMWDEQARSFSGEHRVVRFDCRGFGLSPPEKGPLTMERIADDACLLMDTLGIEKAILWGCSMGGYAALAFARRHKGRFLRLVLQDTRGGADTPEGRERRHRLAREVLREGSGAAALAFEGNLLGETTKREQPALVGWVHETILANPALGVANALLGLGARPDSTPSLGEIDVPTLVVCGSEDVLTPPHESKALGEAIPRSRVEIIPRAGHLANLEQPALVARAFEAFLREVG